MLLVVLVLFSIAIIIFSVVSIDFEDLKLFLELLLSWIFLSRVAHFHNTFAFFFLFIDISGRVRLLVDTWNDTCLLLKERFSVVFALCNVLAFDSIESAHFEFLVALFCVVRFSKECLVIAVKSFKVRSDI